MASVQKWLEKSMLERTDLLNILAMLLCVQGTRGLHFCSARSRQIRGFASHSSSECFGSRKVKGSFAIALGGGSTFLPPLHSLCQL